MPRLECLEAWRLDKDVARINAGVRPHLLDALYLDIQDGYQSFCCLVCNGLFGSAVVVAIEKHIFQEGILGDEGGKHRGGTKK